MKMKVGKTGVNLVAYLAIYVHTNSVIMRRFIAFEM